VRGRREGKKLERKKRGKKRGKKKLERKKRGRIEE
jgi:hypothetical protein